MSVKSSNYDNGSGSYYMVNNTSNKLFTWGEPDRGGSIEATQWSNQPDGVRINVKEAVMTPGGATFFIEIQIDGNGNVINQNEGKVAFTTPSGNSSWHGNLTTPSDTDFEKIYLAGNYMGFLAKKADNTFAGPAGTGLANLGDFITAVNNKKTLFFDVASNRNGIALLFNDGTVISFGGQNVGFSGNVSITGVSQIFAGLENWAGLKSDGTITFWGDLGNYQAGSAETATNISKVFSSKHGYVVITKDNKLYSKGRHGSQFNFTGCSDYGFFPDSIFGQLDNNSPTYISNVKIDDDYPTVAFNIHPIKQGIDNYTDSGGFGYITTDGKVGFKGDIEFHGSLTDNGFTPNKLTDISNCMAIYSTYRAYSIVHTDKRTITLFGRSNPDAGGSMRNVNNMVNGSNTRNPITLPNEIKKVFSTGNTFIYLKDDGTGNDTYSIMLMHGGYSSNGSDLNYYENYTPLYTSAFQFTGNFAGMNTGIVDVSTGAKSVVFVKSDGRVFSLRNNSSGLTSAQILSDESGGVWSYPKSGVKYQYSSYNPSLNIGATSAAIQHQVPWVRNTLSRSKTILDVSNAIIASATFFSSKDLTDYFSGNSIDFNSASDSDIEEFLTNVYNTANTTSITTNLALKIINLLPAKSSVVVNKLFTLLNTANQTLTLANVLTVTEKAIFDNTKTIAIASGNTTPTSIEKEIFKGLKELSFRKLRQDLKGVSLETKIKDISANDNDLNISTYLSSINADLSLNLTDMDLSGVDLTNTDLSGATLVNTDFSGATLTGSNFQGADVSGANLSNVNFNLADFTNLQNFTKTTGVAKNLPSTHQYYLNQPVLSTQNLSNGSYVASTDTIGPFKDGESIAINGVQITFGNSISEAGLLGINNNADGGAFTFIKDDNRLEGWGNPYKGGDLPSDISNVKAIFSTNNAKSAICNDGKVFSWGVSGEGGNAPSDLSGVIDIQSNEKAFVGLYHDGDIVCWGDSSTGGTKPSDVSNVIQLYSNKNAFSALQSDGSIKSWGLITGTAPTTKNFIDIYSTNSAFAALDSSGNVSCWGSSDSRENTPPTDLSNVSLIYGNDDAFAALIADGTVMCWGNTTNGGTTPAGLNNVDYISNTNTAFTAVKNDGTTVCWGNSSNGGTKTTSSMGYESTIAVTADASGNFKFSGYDDSSGNVSFINNETQKDAAFIIDNDYYFNNITSSSDNIVYISNKEYNNTTTQTFTFKTLKNIASMNRSNANSYIKIGFIYTGGGTDYSSYRYNNIFSQANCPSYFLDNPAWMKTESKTLTLKLLSDKMTLEGHDGATVYQNTTVFGSPSTYKLAIAIQNGMILLQNPFTTSYPALYHDLKYKFDQSDSSNAGNTLKFSSMGVSGELLEYTTTEVGTPGSSGAFTILKNTDKNIKQLYPYSEEKGLDAGRKHKILNFSIKTIVVTVVASKFVFDGDTSSSPTINHNTLYKFDVSHSSNLNHPLSFSNDNTTTDYNANRFGTAGSAGAFVTFENNDDKNYNMYIHCKTHGTGMGSHYSPIVISRIKSKDISDINKVFSTKTAFAGLKNDGSIVTWGNNDEGGTFPNNNTFENLSNKIDYDIHDYIKMSRWAGGWPPAHHVCIITKSGGFWTSDNNSYNPAHSTRGLKTEKISDIMSGIKKMVTNPGAVAVLKEDGSVITWGEASPYPQNNDSGKANYGGNSMKFLNELKSNVIDIVKTSKAFCALKNDGTIFTWGDSGFGGNYSIKYSEITDIKKIIGSYSAFAAISNTGKLYVWGKYGYIGHDGWGESFEGLSDTSQVDDIKLESGVVDMYFNLYAGFALKDDGLGTSTYKLDSYWKSDNVYGDPNYSSTGLRNHSGYLDSSILDSGIKKVFAICNSFFFLKTDNKLYGYGGLMNTSVINTEKLSSLVNISTVCFTSYAGGGSAAVAALKSDGSVITWGTTSNGGDKTDNTYGARDKSGAQIDTLLDSGVVKLYSNAKSFCALKSNGDIVCWGDSAWGGNPTLGRGTGIIDSDFQNFVKITSLYDENRRHSDYYYGRGFAGLKKNGSIIVWGLGAAHAGYSTEDLKNSRDFVDVICGNYQNNVFVGVKKDGSIRIFGESASGSAVQNSVLWSTSQSWNASYKEGHVHLPGTVKTPLTQSTYLTTKKETITIKNEVYKTISATDKAFAGITESGDVTVWGDNDYGGIQTDLSDETNFTHLFSNRGSFAGLKDDQTMFNWGNKNFGSLGGPSADITISPNLQEINQYTESYRKSNIFSEFGINADTKKIVDNSYTSNAEGNALINIDGTVDTWGNTAFGGLTTNLSNNLKNVKEIITGGGVMTALKADGTTTTWKNNAVYETNKPVGLNNIKKLVSGSDGMVVALKADGTVAAWHNASNTWDLCGNVASNDLTNLSGIVDIYASNKCFAALKYDNSLYVWGSKENSENRIVHNITTEASKLTSGVKEVYVNGKVLIALKFDGTVVTIGNVNNGGDISNNDVQYKLYGGTATDIAEVFLNDKFAIGIKKDNSCVYWGDISRNATLYNNDITTFTNIKTIVYSKDVMVGIKFDGSIVGIGEKNKGAETPIIDAALKVFATTNNGFSVLKTNNEVITWGDNSYGGQII